jgi:hypothetical protein
LIRDKTVMMGRKQGQKKYAEEKNMHTREDLEREKI